MTEGVWVKIISLRDLETEISGTPSTATKTHVATLAMNTTLTLILCKAKEGRRRWLLGINYIVGVCLECQNKSHK